MSYISPIEIADRMTSQLEEDVINVILSYGIEVDKDELIKALSYDRKQYEKGFADGQRAGERKVNVKRVSYKDTMEYESDGECSCGKCVDSLWDFCPRCGARLEWE